MNYNLNFENRDHEENIVLKLNNVDICLSKINQSYDFKDIVDILKDNDWDLDNFPKRDTIFKKNGLYYIISKSNSILYINNIYDNYDDALDNLNRGAIDLGEFDLENQGKYIYNSKSNFSVVKQSNNKTRYFGSFKSIKDANIAKIILDYYNWDLSAINKTIFKINSSYYTIIVINNSILILNESSSLKDARHDKDQVVMEAIENFRIKQQHTNIYRSSRNRYIVQKSIKNKTIRYGFACTLEGAKALKILIRENDWDMNNIDDYNLIYNGEYYYAFYKYHNQFHVLGRFKNLEDSFILENNLNREFIISRKSKISTNIYGLHKQFVVSRFENGIDHIYGYYPSYDEAVFIRKLLKENNWDKDYFIDNNIFQKDDEYVIIANLEGKIRFLRTFDKYGDALNQRDNVIEDFEIKSHKRKAKYIYKVKNKYIIQKFHNGKMCVFGRYKTFTDAINLKRLLIELNWDISKINETGNIFKIHKEYTVILEDNGQLHLLGIFPSYNEALKNRDKLVSDKISYLNSASNPYSKKNKNIRKTKRGYNVSKRINGELIVFGVYDTYEEAIKARDQLIENNWATPEKPTAKADDLNSIIFNLTRWQKVVFDVIENLDKKTFQLKELEQFKSSFTRFTTPNKVEKKIKTNIEDLVNLGLLEKINDETYEKLWMY